MEQGKPGDLPRWVGNVCPTKSDDIPQKEKKEQESV